MQTKNNTQTLISELLNLLETHRKVSMYGFPCTSSDSLEVRRIVNKIADIKGVDLSSEFFAELLRDESSPLIQRMNKQRLEYLFEDEL